VAPSRDVTGLFADLVSRADGDIHLPAAALAIARIQYPDLDLGLWLDEVSELRRAADRAVQRHHRADPLDVLIDLVFEEYGFDGDRDNYYDPRNNFLNDVLERRMGIPITLALVFLEAAAGAGIPVAGVGFPGHFLVCHPPTGRYIDVFRRGLFLDRPAFLELLRRQGLGPEAWREEFLRPVTRSQMLARMLNNLRRHYAQEADQDALATVGSMLHALEAARESGVAVMVQ
jgi:regulator of sirC expression with transglutaminase-like and TPR domain